jgi:hypothetical protein
VYIVEDEDVMPLYFAFYKYFKMHINILNCHTVITFVVHTCCRSEVSVICYNELYECLI